MDKMEAFRNSGGNDLLRDPLIGVRMSGGVLRKVSMPELLDALSRDEVESLPGCRTHQDHSVRMFLSQLVSLATDEGMPSDPEGWRRALADLAPYPEAWHLVAADDKAAFMQPAAAGVIGKWNSAPSPSDIDVLVTARNHSAKNLHSGSHDDDVWLWALVTLQTGVGYSGPNLHGSFRMNSGTSSRVMMAVYDRSWGYGRRIFEDADLCSRTRHSAALRYGFAAEGGVKLMWTAPWVEGTQLSSIDLDPRVIEVCRRIRMARSAAGHIVARYKPSVATRTDMAATKSEAFRGGVVGDIWAAIFRKEGKANSISLSAEGLGYDRICRFTVTAEKHGIEPAPAVLRDVENAILTIAGIACGQGKTQGIHRREIAFGRSSSADLFRDPTVGETAGTMIADAKNVSSILSSALKAYAGEKVAERSATHYRDMFNNAVDEVFFDHLERLHQGGREERVAWVASLFQAGKAALEAAIQCIPVRTSKSWQLAEEARGAYFGGFFGAGLKGFADMKADIIKEQHG